MKKYSWINIIIVVALAFCSCSHDPGVATQKVDTLPDIFPDYIDVTVPSNIAPLNFGLAGVEAIKAVFSLEGCEKLTVCGDDYVDINIDDWHKLLDDAKGKSLTVTVSVWDDIHPEGVAYKPFNINVREEIDSWLVYRLIDPGYDSWGHIGIYQRDLTCFDELPLVTNEDNRARCVNCHSFADYDANTMMYHQRSVDPATVILHDGIEERVDLKSLGIKKQGLYCKWHPSGKYIVFSNNGTHQSFLDRGQKVLEVYDTHSSLFLYDVKKQEVTTDSLLYNDTAMQTFATWSEDGKWLYYCTAPQVDGFPEAFENVKYSIVRMGFDVNTGKFDEIADTIYNARTEEHSASFPRISPDGRYMLFSEADCGTFPVYHPEAALQIIDLETGDRLNTDVLNSDQSESYHSWSSTGRWMVYQSRRMDGRHTRLMLAYFDKDGKAYKPFLLPQQNPENNRTRIWSFNVPEFVKNKIAAKLK